MRKTRLVALLLVVVLVASMVVPSVSAAEEYTISLVDNSGAATVTAKAGDTLSLKLELSNNPGVSMVGVTVERPEGWEFTARPTNKKLFDETAESAYTASPNTSVNPYVFTWTMATGTFENEEYGTLDNQLSKENGTLATMKIKVPENAASGTYTVKLALRSGSNFAQNVDANGIINNTGKYDLYPVLESLTVIVEGEEPVPTATPCAKCGDAEWTEIAENAWAAGGELTTGHYKLTGKQDTTAVLSVAADQTVCIDLNGYTIAAASAHRMFANSGTLSIMDSSEAKTGTVQGAQIKGNGANIKNEAGATFNLYSGTITGGRAVGTTTSTSYGGNFWSKGNLNLLGGVVTNGYSEDTDDGDNGRGGNIYTEGGTLTIENCVVSNGISEVGGNGYMASTTVTIKGNAQILDGESIGTYSGNLYISASPTTIQDNVVISGGVAKTGGGNIYGTGAKTDLIIKGNVQIKDGVAGSAGGNIYCNSSSKLTIQDNVVIKDGQGGAAEGVESNWGGGNIYVFTGVVANISGNVQILGGTSSVRATSIVARSSAVLTISGNVKITAQKGTLPAMTEYSGGTIKIQAGVTTYAEPVGMVDSCVAYNITKDAEGVTCYKTYATLDAALDAAVEGDEVKLAADATGTDVVVPAGVTLDLNGKNLTANELAAGFAGAKVKDSVGTSKVKVDDYDSASFTDNNGQLPITTADGIVFETPEFAQNLAVDTTAVYKFYIKNEAAKTMLDDSITAGEEVSIVVRVEWVAGGEGKYKNFVFPA